MKRETKTRPKQARWWRVLGSVVACAVAIGAEPASGAQIFVNSTDDPGTLGCDPAECTLREGIAASNANGSAQVDEIKIIVPGIVDLQSQLPGVLTPVTISGPGPDSLTVRRGAGSYPIFTLQPAAGTTQRVEGVRIADGTLGINATVAAMPGQVVLDNVWIRANVGSGGIRTTASLTVMDSTLSGNQVTGAGGSIFASGGATVTVVNTTIANNSATVHGGGVYIEDSGTTIGISSSTIVGNKADSDDVGGGDGGGVYNNNPTGAPFLLANTILANNKVGTATPVENQCGGTPNPVTSHGHNLRTNVDGGCSGFGTPTDVVDPSPLLGTLGENGGPTPTIALLVGSPALDGGYTSDPFLPPLPPCPANDQRGLPRGGPNGSCDRGAFELQKSPSGSEPPATCRGVRATHVGTAGADVLRGTPNRDVFSASSGADRAFGFGGRDLVCLGPGRDIARGGGGRDHIRGQAGPDKLIGGGGRDKLLGQAGRDVLRGGGGRDVLRGGPGRDLQRQ